MTDFAKRHRWWLDAARLYVGLITRAEATKRGVPHMTLPAYGPELGELHSFSVWLHWRYGGRKPPEPTWRPKQKLWAYTVYVEFVKAHPKPPPTPPPPPPGSNPPSIWTGHPNVPWYRKRVDISYWCRPDVGLSISLLIDRLHQSGTKAVCFQFGDDCPDPDWASHGLAVYAACKSEGIACGTWGRADYADWDKVKAALHSVMPVDGIMADVEGPCNDPELPEHLVAEFPGVPLAVISTGGIDEAFAGHSPNEVAARFGDHFDFVGQDYYKQSDPMTPDRGENFVYWRGTEKNGGRGFRHLPDAGNRWHVPTIMAYAETCPPLVDHHAWCQGWSPIGHWDAEILEGNDAWGEWAKF